MPIERRKGSSNIPILAVCISAAALVLGPCFGAASAVIGTIVANQSKNAVAEQRLSSIESKVDKIVDQNDRRQRDDGKTESTLSEHDRRLTAAEKDIASLKEHDSQQERTMATIGGMTASSIGQQQQKK